MRLCKRLAQMRIPGCECACMTFATFVWQTTRLYDTIYALRGSVLQSVVFHLVRIKTLLGCGLQWVVNVNGGLRKFCTS